MSDEHLPNVYLKFRDGFPGVAKALDGLGEAVDGAGPLDERTGPSDRARVQSHAPMGNQSGRRSAGSEAEALSRGTLAGAGPRGMP